MDSNNNSFGDGGINPRKDANVLSVITFFYNFKILFKGKKKDLQEDDLYKVLPKFKASKLGDKLERQWRQDEHSKKGKASLLMCWLKCFGLTYLVYTVLQLAFSTAMILLQPKVFSKFVAYFQKGQTELTKKDAYVYALAVVGLDLLAKIYNQNFAQLVNEYSIRVRTALCSLIFRKALRVSPKAFATITIGKIVTFVSKDIYSIDGQFFFLKDMIIGYLQLGVVTYLLYQRVGTSAFLAVGVLLAVILIQVIGGIKIKDNRLKTVIQSDVRFKLLQETLSSIKVIKMYLWYNYFEKLIKIVRKEEIVQLRWVYFLKAVIIALGGCALNLAFYAVFMLYISKGNTIDAQTVYFVQQLLAALGTAISTSIPFGITETADTVASLQRIQAFLEAEELSEPQLDNDSQKTTPKIRLRYVDVSLKGKKVLKSISLTLDKKGLLIITGTVGSGKSTLLKTILGEHEGGSCTGQIDVKGTFSYAGQEPWLFPSTIRQNILFGQAYSKRRYQKVLDACALTYDIKKFEDRDQTIVGDKGMNLSKGQQARISLARAVYKDSDIYLLDDCLSALDNRVSNHIFEKCIKGLLGDKICLLVTNNLSYINRCVGNVLYLNDGEVGTTAMASEGEEEIIYEGSDENLKEEKASEVMPLWNSNGVSTTSANIYHEQNKEGKVLWSTYANYYRYLGGIFVCLLLLLVFLAAQFCTSYGSKIISWWVNLEADINEMLNNSQTNTTEYQEAIGTRWKYLETYTILMATGLVLFIVKGLCSFHFCLRAGRRLHQAVVKAMLGCYMSFFDDHFIGNVINRLSKDFYTIDEYIPFLVYDCSRSFFSSVGVIVLLATVSWGFVVLTILLFIALFFLMRFYLPTGRSLRRLDSATRSPVIGYLNSTLEGLPIVRAAQQQSQLQWEFDRHQDLYTSAYYTNQTTARLFAFLIDILGTLFIFSITFKFILLPQDNHAGDVGLAISQAMALSGVLQWVFKQMAEIETVMTSVERVLEYSSTPTEPTTTGREPGPNWLTAKGTIEFRKVFLAYPSRHHNDVLRDLNFKINAGERVAIVGRTGAGKSSIISTLFRLYDFKGDICIGDENIRDLSLGCLRGAISIIPQDPLTFSGTVRTNMDPLQQFSDEDVWRALKSVQADNFIVDLSADCLMSLSAGQRQLMCLARALMRNNKLVILDEVAANLDEHLEGVVEEVVRQRFKGCTVLIVAHRLEFVRACDRVMVVHDGRVVEFDRPDVLLEKEGGYLRKLVYGES